MAAVEHLGDRRASLAPPVATHTMNLAAPRWLRLLALGCVVAGYLWFGLSTWRAEAYFTNRVERGPDHALIFPAPSIATTLDPPSWLDAAIDAADFQLTIDMQSQSTAQQGPARIVSLSRDTIVRNFTLGQEGADLVIRWRRSADTVNGTPAFFVRRLFTDGERHAILVVAKGRLLQVYADGQKRIDVTFAENPFAHWARDFPLVFGNEVTFDRPWRGDILRAVVRVNGMEYDYLLPGSVVMPSTYIPGIGAHRPIQAVPFMHEWYSPAMLRDWALNLLGFVPLGMLLIGLFPRTVTVMRATLMGFSLSLAIEAAQWFFPWRVTSVDDLTLNTLGAMLGAGLARALYRYFRSDAPAMS